MTILKQEEQAVFKLRSLYRQYGYCPYKMSRFEEYELYVHNKDFLQSDQIITFSGSGGKLMALKPDVTLSIIRHTQDLPGEVRKVYYDENVYRADGNSQNVKQIMQAGLECVGDLGAYEIAEVVLLAAQSMALLGEHFVLDISHVGLTGAVLDECGLAGQRRKAALQCLRQKNAHELRTICSNEKLQMLVRCGGNAETALESLEAVLSTEAERQALTELRMLCAVLAQAGYADRVRVDFSVGNDMKYYSGVVFKGYLEGIPTGILSGGQYDRLLKKMGRKARAIGFAVYLSMLEGRNTQETYDIDTLILHGPDTDPAALVAEARQWAAQGTVLVAREQPRDRKWNRLITM